jgi:hypothetical protein
MKTTTAKQTVTGKIISTKTQDGDYGPAYKMLVQCDGFRVWSTIPAALFDAADKHLRNVEGWIVALRGCDVSFVATLEQSDRDAGFFFAKRPTKAQLVAWPADKTRLPDPWEVEGPSTEAGEDPFAQFETAA